MTNKKHDVVCIDANIDKDIPECICVNTKKVGDINISRPKIKSDRYIILTKDIFIVHDLKNKCDIERFIDHKDDGEAELKARRLRDKLEKDNENI